MSGSGSDSVSIGDVEHRKLKSKMEEEPALDVADSEPSLSLRLGLRNPTTGHESSTKSLKIYEESGSNSPKSSELWNGQEGGHQINGDFACKYCTRTFTSSQALGGHQNAHRHERALKKLGKDTNKNKYHQFGSHLAPYPYSTMANRPYHGSSSLLLNYPLARMPSSWPLHAPAAACTNLSNSSFTGHPFGSVANHPRLLPLQGVGVGEQSPIMVPIPDESSESEEEELDLTLRL